MNEAIPFDVDVPRFLDQVGREFMDLSAELERLQDTISELLSTTAIEPRVVEQAQALDHVFQHAAELGAILRRAAEQASPAWRLPTRPILAAVSLSDLAHRLSGREAVRADGGELEMF
jgi:hypothetical protein